MANITINQWLQILKKLMRFYLSLTIAFSALAGQILYSHGLSVLSLYAFLGVFLLSGAASALNHYQERHWDALMQRTQNRPLPLKQLQPRTVISISILLFVSGSFILYYGSAVAMILGWFNILWYNFLYTPLKRYTKYAILVGALTGAVPPMMGWVIPGGNFFDVQIICVALFMFLWQIPHFWIILLKYRKEYEQAGFPSVVAGWTESRIKWVILIWVVGTSVSSMFFAIFNVIVNYYLILGLVTLNVSLVFYFCRIFFRRRFYLNNTHIARYLYGYQAMILILLMIDAIGL